MKMQQIKIQRDLKSLSKNGNAKDQYKYVLNFIKRVKTTKAAAISKKISFDI